MEPMAKIALRAARLAGQVIVRGFDRPDLVRVSTKGRKGLVPDMVTNIDREAEQIILATLREKYPEHQLVGEESGTQQQEDSDYEWLIDPLDGTMNFVRQIPHFCVSIACIHRGKPRHAVVLDPMRQEEFVTSRGRNTELNGRRIRASNVEQLSGAVVCTGGHIEQQHIAGEVRLGKHLMDAGCIMRHQGSAALELAYVAAGRVDAMWMRGLSPWDMAAGALLVTEAGGLVGDFDGGANYMKTGNIVAGTPRCFRHLTAGVKQYLT